MGQSVLPLTYHALVSISCKVSSSLCNIVDGGNRVLYSNIFHSFAALRRKIGAQIEPIKSRRTPLQIKRASNEASLHPQPPTRPTLGIAALEISILSPNFDSVLCTLPIYDQVPCGSTSSSLPCSTTAFSRPVLVSTC